MSILAFLSTNAGYMAEFAATNWLALTFAAISIAVAYVYYHYLGTEKIDSRIYAILVATSGSVAITALVYIAGGFQSQEGFIRDVFAGWVASVLFFAAIGAVVAFVSLAKPEDQSPESRARILFKGETGPHIDYIVKNISDEIGHYAEITSTRITLRSYDRTNNMYRLSIKNDYLIRNYIYDADTTFSNVVKMDNMTQAPPGRDDNTLVYVRIDGETIGETETFTTSVERQIVAHAEAHKTLNIVSEMEFWVVANTEPNNHKVKRFTRVLKVEIDNFISPPTPVTVRFKKCADLSYSEIVIPHGKTTELLNLKNVLPKTEAYTFCVMSA